MSQRQLILNIPEPCAERWQAMTPVTGGRHCNSCSKTVFDFTTYSDTELIRVLTQRQYSSVCCRLNELQLNRALKPAPAPSFLKVQWQRTVALFLVIQTFTTHVLAQHTRKGHAIQAAASRENAHKELKGRLVNFDYGTPLPNLSFDFSINDTGSVRLTTDDRGSFKVPLPGMFRSGFAHWGRQEVANGFIIPDTAQVTSLNGMLTIYWQRVKDMDPVVIEVVNANKIYAGVPVIRVVDAGPKKNSFFRWLVSPFRKKQKS